MSICDTIVRRMSGTLDVASTVGKGTLVRITLPLDFSGTSSPPSPSTAPRQLDTPTATSPSTFTRRVLSDELSALFTPGQKLGATPVEERPSYGFSEAVDRAHDALGTKPRVHRIPSMRQKRPGTAGMTADLVVDAAKLSLTANAAPPSPVVQQKEEKQKVSVLFADDNAIARNILAKLLGSKVSLEALSLLSGRLLLTYLRRASLMSLRPTAKRQSKPSRKVPSLIFCCWMFRCRARMGEHRWNRSSVGRES